MGDETTTRFEGSTLIVETGDEKEEYDAKYLAAALLVSVANSDGEISAIETQKMLELVGNQLELKSSESLEVLTRAMEDLRDKPDLDEILREVATVLTDAEKENIALMMYKVVDADGMEAFEEMNAVSAAAELIGISTELMQKARQRFFAER